jgi:hypothetical protein
VNGWDFFKFVHNREAIAYFDCKARDITEPQWLYFFAMKKLERENEERAIKNSRTSSNQES